MLLLTPKVFPKLNQYQLKRIASFLYAISQLLLGAVALQIFEIRKQGKLDIPLLVMLVLYTVNSIVLFGVATFVAGKVKDKYA